MKNTNIGNNCGVIGDGNIIVFNMQTPITKEQIEESFSKLEIGDFQDITEEVDESFCEKKISMLSYTKNYRLQLKKQLVCDDFNESWIPDVTADMEGREKKPKWKITPIYQGNVLPFPYFFIGMDRGHYLIPLPRSDKNGSTKRYTITKAQYQLGKVLTNGDAYNESYDDILEQCNITVID